MIKANNPRASWSNILIRKTSMDYLEATMQVLSSLYMDIVKGGYQNERKESSNIKRRMYIKNTTDDNVNE